jgi:hypothetical protein
MKPSRAPVFELVLVSMGRYCQEGVTQILNDFAAVRTFLLIYEETVSRWPGSCLSFDERFDESAVVVACAGQVRPSQPPQSRAADRTACFAAATNETPYRCSQRTTLGDMPVIRRKCLARWLWSENPADSAISDIGRSVVRSIFWACSMRRCST